MNGRLPASRVVSSDGESIISTGDGTSADVGDTTGLGGTVLGGVDLGSAVLFLDRTIAPRGEELEAAQPRPETGLVLGLELGLLGSTETEDTWRSDEAGVAFFFWTDRAERSETRHR